ncbi:hypothetical protein AA0111_g11865 [Alternaria arborescens]|uniref:hypothetical protein n=1 Tax=Alternaria arborescens TaxID=156630 RepID=UPI001075587A|nr:hypothetical protein AA0111_g11865 [Alternaria arborescens]RYO14841.1 hypothetical protein AA0111_g11865 [Alternaria arborescens]
MVLLASLLFAAFAGAKCFEPDIAHPPPEYNVHDPLLKEAFESINTALTAAVAAPIHARSSFSVEVTSSEETLWSYHHTAFERNASRPDIPKVNGDALYRIASITKTFTVLGILYQHAAGNLSLDETVNTYLKELGEKSDGGIPWKDITLRSLASQLSGLPRECKLPVDKEHNLFDGCQIGEDLFKQVNKLAPLFAPNQKSSYSNLAFELLGLVLSRVSNRTYEAYIDEAIFKPLNMSTSTLSKPADSAGVIPAGPQFWDVQEGVQNPTGGIYSSSSDLSKYLRYVLTHFNAITHAINWLHPVSHSHGSNSFYGMPWEIFTTDRVLKDSNRTIRVVSKSGGLPGYTSIIMTVPEYDLGITILIAGPAKIFAKIQSIVLTTMIQVAEKIAIRQLGDRYAGTYSAADPELNSTVILTADHRGLVVTTWISNGTDVFKSPIVKDGAPEHYYAQLSPTLLYRDEETQRGEEWRAMFVEEREGGPPDDFCIDDWDMSSYAGIPLNAVAFWDEQEDGHFGKLELSAFRVNLTRADWKGGKNREYDQQEAMEL